MRRHLAVVVVLVAVVGGAVYGLTRGSSTITPQGTIRVVGARSWCQASASTPTIVFHLVFTGAGAEDVQAAISYDDGQSAHLQPIFSGTAGATVEKSYPAETTWPLERCDVSVGDDPSVAPTVLTIRSS